MNTAVNHLEDIQRMMLFLFIKRDKIVTYSELMELDENIRNCILQDSEEVIDDLLKWQDDQHQSAVNSLVESFYKMMEVQDNDHSQQEVNETLVEYLKYFEYLRNTKAHSRFQDVIAHQFISEIADIILEAARDLQISLKSAPIFGTLYTNRVNALAVRVPKSNNHLILIESNLIHFLNRFTQLIVRTFVRKGENDKVFHLSCDIDDVRENLKNNRTIQLDFDDLLRSFVIDKKVDSVVNTVLDRPRYILSTHILKSIDYFIIGHELGHVIRGHINQKTESTKTNTTTDELRNRNWNMEYEADILGLQLSVQALKKEGFKEDFYLIGGEFHFILSDIISKAKSIIKTGHEENSNMNDSHPFYIDRRKNIRRVMKDELNDDEFESAIYLPNTMEMILNELWSKSKHLFLEHYKLNTKLH